MSTAFTIKTVRDPIYGCVYLTPAEQLIVDRPEFQRLRFVLQQSTAYFTYPSNSTTRFSHSLGACHLAGQMFLSSLSNSDNSTLSSFLSDAEHIVTKAFGKARASPQPNELSKACDELIGNPFILHSTPPFTNLPSSLDSVLHSMPSTSTRKYPPLLTITIFWQAIRYATLVHDLGHLPMSHLFEHAIDEFELAWTAGPGHEDGRGPLTGPLFRDFEAMIPDLDLLPSQLVEKHLAIHERLGCMLFAKIFPSLKRGDDTHNALLAAIAWIAKCIVLISPSDASSPTPADLQHWRTLRYLHLLIAGELDADRLDYSARDPLASAMEFGPVSHTKIIRATRLISINTPEKTTEYVQAIDRRAVLDAEFFYIQRFYALRAIVNHHNVQRSEAIMRHLLRDLIGLCFNDIPTNPHPLVSVCREYCFWTNVSSHGTSTANGRLGPLTPESDLIGRFDDSWLRAFLYSVWKQAERSRVGTSSRIDLNVTEHRIEHFCDIILNRRVELCMTANKVDADSVGLLIRTTDEAVFSCGKLTEKLDKAICSDIEKRIMGCVDGLFCFKMLSKNIGSLVEFSIKHTDKLCMSNFYVIADFETLRFPDFKSLETRLYVATEYGPPLSFRNISHVIRAFSDVANVDDSRRNQRIEDVLSGDFGIPRLRIFLVGPDVADFRRRARENPYLQNELIDAVSKGLASGISDMVLRSNCC